MYREFLFLYFLKLFFLQPVQSNVKNIEIDLFDPCIRP